MRSIIAKKRIKERGVLRMVLAVLVSYFMLIPLVFFGIMLEVYHRICFWIYGIPYIDRRKYIKLDRGKLRYLSLGDKINCVYCGYANGFIYYAYRIISETEKYWCPIKHAERRGKLEFFAPPHHKKFAEFGNENELKDVLENK